MTMTLVIVDGQAPPALRSLPGDVFRVLGEGAGSPASLSSRRRLVKRVTVRDTLGSLGEWTLTRRKYDRSLADLSRRGGGKRPSWRTKGPTAPRRSSVAASVVLVLVLVPVLAPVPVGY